jgi:tRNA pseudouridine13 synthase
MKIKVRPEDFVVEECTSIPVVKEGPFTLVKLTKKYWNTLDAIDLLARHLSVPRAQIARAGLKDRYSQSTQYLTIKGAFNEPFRKANVQFSPAGHTQEPMSPRFLQSNRFTITLRDCSTSELSNIHENTPLVTEYGIVNYFDEQRFGSVRHGKGFFAKALMRTHFRGALKLLLCFPHRDEEKQERTFKRFCAEHWGAWKDCLTIAPPQYRSILNALVHRPRDYRGAIKKIDRELLNLYLLAYQSYLWNEIVSAHLKTLETECIQVPYSMGTFSFIMKPPPSYLMGMTVPLLNDKSVFDDHLSGVIHSILDREEVVLKDFALQKIRFRGVRFKSYPRKVIVIPQRFTVSQPQSDELYTARQKVQLRFELPPGSYATLMIKRLIH